MTPIYVITVLTVLNNVVFMASRFTILLYAIQLHASPTAVGVLGALFAVLSSLTLVSVGRWVDRMDTRGPMLGFSIALAVSAVLPFVWQALPALFISATLVGWAYNSFWVCSQQVVGRISTSETRTANYSVVTLGLAMSSFLGPVLAGFAVDQFGHPVTMLLFAMLPIVPTVVIALNGAPTSPGRKAPDSGGAPKSRATRHGLFSLLGMVRLRRVFIVAVTLAAGWDFFTFLMPIYGAELHLSASTIGLLFGAFTGGVITIRICMPFLSRRVAPWRLLLSALAIAGLSYSLFPVASGFQMLMAVSLLLGLGMGVQLPVTSALLYEYSPPDRGGEAIGLKLMLININATVLPLLAGVLSDLAGVIPVFLMAAALLFGVLHNNRARWNVSAREDRES